MADLSLPEVILTVGGTRHRGWKEIRITRGIEHGAFGFELLLTESWGNNIKRDVQADEVCTLKLANELLLTGYIDAVEPEHDAKTHGIRVRGRSKVGDMVDSSTTGKEFKNQTLLQIASYFGVMFDVPVKVAPGVNIGAPFKSLRIAPGQGVFEFLEFAARIRGLRLVSTPEGELLITRAGSRHADTALILGKNIRSARGLVDISQTFRNYTVISQQGENPLLSSEAQAYPKASVIDFRSSRIHRSTVIELDNPSDNAGCKDRALWERNTRFGRSRSAMIVVSGWQQTPGGRTWLPNELVQVDDAMIAVKGPRLITQADIVLDDQGSRTEITVQPKEAFDLNELPEPDDSEVWG